MAIIELLLMIFKTIILSIIYSTIVLLILVLIAKYSDKNWAKKWITRKLRFWLLTHFIISVMLLFTSLFYLHDTGIGDNSIIPLGYGQSIQNEDFVMTYFYPDLTRINPNKDAIDITNYIIADNKICAEVSHGNTESPKYNFLVYDLPTKELTTFNTEAEYTNYAETNNLPLAIRFYNFEIHYQEYLADKPFWQTWLIP